MTDPSPFEPSLVGAIWRDRRLVIAVLLVSFGLAIAYAVTRPVQYTATASVPSRTRATRVAATRPSATSPTRPR